MSIRVAVVQATPVAPTRSRRWRRRAPWSPRPAPSCFRPSNTCASVIADPWGNLLAGPVHGREEILYADCDPGAIIAARRVLDTAGHYDRPDLDRAPPGPA